MSFTENNSAEAECVATKQSVSQQNCFVPMAFFQSSIILDRYSYSRLKIKKYLSYMHRSPEHLPRQRRYKHALRAWLWLQYLTSSFHFFEKQEPKPLDILIICGTLLECLYQLLV